MISDTGYILCEVTACKDAVSGSAMQIVVCKPMILTGTNRAAPAETFEVLNASKYRVMTGDIVPVCKTVQGYFVISPILYGKARWIIVTKNGESYDLNSFWEGANPTLCGDTLSVIAPFALPCVLPDGEQILCCYRPENDDYVMVSTKSALMGTPESGEFAVGDSFSTVICGSLSYESQKFKYFPCCTESGTGGPQCTIPKTVNFGFVYVAAITGVSIGTDSDGNYCYQFARANVLSCGGPNPAMTTLCGYNCPPVCEDTLYYQEFYLASEIVPAGGKDVGDYTDPDTLLVSHIGERCFSPGEDTTGWVAGSGEDLGVGFVREEPSPTCCPPSTNVTTTPYSLQTGDSIVLVDDDTVAGDATVNLMAAAVAGDGYEVIVFKTGSTGTVTVTASGAELINGVSSHALTGQYESIKLATDGTTWYIVEA